MSHLCSVCIHLVCDYTYFSPPSPHREGESDCDSYITNTFKEMGSSVFHLNCVFLSRWEKLIPPLAPFSYLTLRTLIVSRLFVSLPHTGVFRLWLTSQSRRLWGSTWWMHSNANNTARDATVVFLLSLSHPLSLASSLPSFLFLYVSPSMPCFSAALLFVCGKTKKEKMLSFLFVFLFLFSVGFFVFMHLICHVAIHSRSLCLSSPLSSLCLFSPMLWILW